MKTSVQTPSEEDFYEFEDLVKRLLRSDNKIRDKAEEQYHQYLNDDPNFCLQFLLSMLTFSENNDVIVLSLVLLRRSIVSEVDSVWYKCNEHTQNTIQETLFEEYYNQKTFIFKKLLIDILIAVDEQLSQPIEKENETGFKELLTFLFEIIKRNSGDDLQIFMYTLKEMCTYQSQQLNTKVEEISKIFSTSLFNETTLILKQYTINAVCSYIPLLSETNQEEYNCLIPVILETIWVFIKNEELDFSINCLSELIILATMTIEPFKNQLELMLTNMINIFHYQEKEKHYNDNYINNNNNINDNDDPYSDSDDEDCSKMLSIELLITLLETSPETILQCNNYLNEILICIITLFSKSKTNDKIINFRGVTLFERTLLAIGGEHIIQELEKIIPELLKYNPLNYKMPILKIYELLFEGIKFRKFPEFKFIVKLISTFLNDRNVKIILQTIDTIEQLLMNSSLIKFSNDFFDLCSLILQNLLLLLKSENEIIKYNVFLCLKNFFISKKKKNKEFKEFLFKKFYKIILDNILIMNTNFDNQLISQNKQNFSIKEEKINLLIIITKSYPQFFLQDYYKEIMILMRNLLENLLLEKNLKIKLNDFKWKIINYLIIIENNFHMEQFNNNIQDIIEIIIQIQEQDLIIDKGNLNSNSNSNSNSNELIYNLNDPQILNILKTWSKIISLFSEKSLPYLESLILLLLQIISQKIDYIIIDDNLVNNDNNLNSLNNDDFFPSKEIIQMDGKLILIHFFTIKCILKSLKILNSLILNSNKYIIKYSEKILKIILFLISFRYNEKIRKKSTLLIGNFFTTIKKSIEDNEDDDEDEDENFFDNENLNIFYLNSLNELINSIKIEKKRKIVNLKLITISELIEIFGEILNKNELIFIGEIIANEINNNTNRKDTLIKKMKNKINVNYYQSKMEIENQIFESIYQIINSLFEKNMDHFFPIFHKSILNYYFDLTKPFNDPNYSQISFFVLCSIILHGEHQHFELCWENIMNDSIEWLQTKELHVIQAVAYTIGISAQKNQDFRLHAFEANINQLFNLLLQTIQSLHQSKKLLIQNFGNDEILRTNDHLISSIGKICYYYSFPYYSQSPLQLTSSSSSSSLSSSLESSHSLKKLPRITFNEIAPIWLNLLPIQIDHEEAKWNNEILTLYIQKNNQIILGENNSNLSKIFQIFTFSYGTNMINLETLDFIIVFFKKFKNQLELNQEIFKEFDNHLIEKLYQIWENF
ncbi:hypothetical protein M0813_27327 [Anaeramoeba flamelloides]|uniref:IPO4/5-like TPR repeats domain-containing protein n=1 Tax=Anaeramoeba flamelloides TaxID=1746091 RepID=A0ABQ8XWP6_9EUKA|nr:hypothetical protein M0813_27327 [Anaeramoeba flamelloides]